MEGRTSLLFSNTFKGKQTLQLISELMLKELSIAWKNEREATAHITSSLLNLMKRTLFSGYRGPDLRKKGFKSLSVTVSHMILLLSCVLTDSIKSNSETWFHLLIQIYIHASLCIGMHAC